MSITRWKLRAIAPLAAVAFVVGLLGVAPGTASAAPKPAQEPVTALACSEKGPVSATFDARWKANLSLHTDLLILGEEIIAYKIQWFDGTWSDWYVPGMNDVDWVDPNRRVWSYFYDHTHAYLSC